MDPLARALTTIKNGELKGHRECLVYPVSKLLTNVLRIMQKAGYLGEIEYMDDGRGGKMKVQLFGRINNCMAVKPRLPVRVEEMERFEEEYLPAKDLGLLILSTSKGVMTHREARDKGVGGLLIAFVY